MNRQIKFTINGIEKEISASPSMTLLRAIREKAGLTGTKQGCGNGECGACTVIMNGLPVRSCLILAAEADGASITTIEGVAGDEKLSLLQQAFIEEGAVQCGFCTPGFIMAGEALFARDKNPSDNDIREALSGHLCRCTGYEAIFSAFKKARTALRKKRKKPRKTSGQG